MDIIALIAIFVSLILIGLFAGVEIAFVSTNKLSLELNKKQGTYAGKIWGHFAEHPAKFIGANVVIINVFLIIFGLSIGKLQNVVMLLLQPILSKVALPFVTYSFIAIIIVGTTIIVLLIQFVFRAYFRVRSNGILNNNFVAYITQFFYSIFSSVSTALINMAEWILLYVFNVKVNDKKEVFGKVELDNYVQQNKMHNEDVSSDVNKELFENALSLADVRLRECLVPRKEIVGISKESSIDEIKKLFIETRLSKLVVFDKNIDTIIGYVHQLDLFKSPASLQDIILPIPTVPETMTATDLMAKFSKDRKTIAWVIDEFGGTAGIVTMEDLLEEIFGDIKDEYDDVEEFVDKQLSANEYLFSGRVELDLIAEKYELEFPEDETAETLSGFIVQHNGDIPKEKQQIIIGNYEFSIMSMSDTRIETVKLKVLRKP
jgi:CBS domain containing-hemolysin-like protein